MPKKRMTISKLKKKVWSACSIFIRKSYADNFGYVYCYTCGKRMQIKEAQAGHGFAGRSKAVLFMLDIIKPQCFGCNCCASGRLDVFTYKLRKEYGNERFDYLYKQAHTNQGQWRAEELQEWLEYFQLKGGTTPPKRGKDATYPPKNRNKGLS